MFLLFDQIQESTNSDFTVDNQFLQVHQNSNFQKQHSNPQNKT